MSFSGQLALAGALPGATVLEVDDCGLRPSSYDDLELVTHWRAYLADPMRHLRHVPDP